jgi:hypothetical protein
MQPMALKLNHYNMKRSAMKTLLGSLFLILLISIIGCKKEEVQKNSTSTGTGLVGKWEWVDSKGGFSYVHLTPQKLGYTYWIAFTNDSMYQVYDKKINIMTSSNRFTVFNAISIFTTHLHQMMKADNMFRSSFEIRNDSLFMYEEAADGFDMIFIRK